MIGTDNHPDLSDELGLVGFPNLIGTIQKTQIGIIWRGNFTQFFESCGITSNHLIYELENKIKKEIMSLITNES